MFVKVGDEVNAGDVVVEVSERPVMVMPGDITMYRDITSGCSGRQGRQATPASPEQYRLLLRCDNWCL